MLGWVGFGWDGVGMRQHMGGWVGGWVGGLIGLGERGVEKNAIR